MPNLLSILARPVEESRVLLPTAEIVFNHPTRTVFMWIDLSAETNEKTFEDLQKHFAKRGYFLQVLAASVTPVSAATSQPIEKSK